MLQISVSGGDPMVVRSCWNSASKFQDQTSGHQSGGQFAVIYRVILRANTLIRPHPFIPYHWVDFTYGEDQQGYLGNIKLPPPLNFTFNWEDQQGYLGNINFPPPLNFTFNWEDQQRYLGNIKLPPPLNFTFNGEDQQRL